MSWDGVNRCPRSVEHCTISWPNWDWASPNSAYLQLIYVYIPAVVNKHNTARVASCWFIIYYRLVMHGNLNIKYD